MRNREIVTVWRRYWTVVSPTSPLAVKAAATGDGDGDGDGGGDGDGDGGGGGDHDRRARWPRVLTQQRRLVDRHPHVVHANRQSSGQGDTRASLQLPNDPCTNILAQTLKKNNQKKAKSS
jgi:hypothetical protein